jgi:hypothetical protein
VAPRRLLAAVLTLGVLVPAAAQAAPGDIVRTIPAGDQTGGCRPSVGLAFDGTNLITTCPFDNVLDVIRPSDGTVVRHVTVTGARNLGAASYDRTRARLWVCNGVFSGDANDLFEARLVDLGSGSSERAFFTSGCPFALAFDGSDDSVYASRTGSCTMNHYSSAGTLLATANICSVGAPDVAGLAVGTDRLYVGSSSGGVFPLHKDLSAVDPPVSTLGSAALACDDVTFAPRTVIWVSPGTERTLTAIELPAGSCPFGGGVPRPRSKEDCKRGGWRQFGFRNQGQCVASVVRPRG